MHNTVSSAEEVNVLQLVFLVTEGCLLCAVAAG